MPNVYRVLYVDDEPDLLHITQIFLEQSGEFQVETAGSAQQALDSPSILSYDAIISDYQMAGMDGIAFLKAVRERSGDIPFILFTGRGREEVVIGAINNGADFYLQKGGDPKTQYAELVHKIKKAIERRQAQNALKDSEQRLTDIINFLPDATFVIDRSGRVIAWNRAIEEMTGVSAAEMLGKSDYEYAIPFYGKRRPILIDLIYESDEAIAKNYAHIIHRKDILIADTTLPQPKGKPVTLMGKASPLYNRHGEIVGAIESIRDVTEMKKTEDELRASYEQIAASEEELRHQFDELKKSEDALRKSEEKYRSILENIQDVYYRTDPAGNLVLASPSGAKLLGYDSVSELIGESIAQTAYLDPEERSKFLAELNSRGSVTDYEVALKKRDGTSVVVSTSSHRYYDEKGNFLGVEGIFRDITERKKMEESLKVSEEKYRSLVDNLNVGVYRNTAELPGRWLWANRAFVRIFGYDSLQECMEHPVTEVYVNPEERKKFIQILETDGFVKNYELQLKKKDGSHIRVLVTARAKKNRDGKIEWVDGICDDVTALKEAEEEVRRYQFEMSRAVDYLPDPTFIINRKGAVVAWNRAIEDMTGVAAKDIIGRGDYEYAIPFYGYRRPVLIDLIFNSEDELKKRDYPEIKQTGKILSVETPNAVLKGKPAIVRAVAAPIYDESGNITGAIETIIDITELKRAQKELMESENRYRTIFENTGTATVLLNENTVISIANAEFERLSGFLRAELEGKKSWTEFVVPEDLERMLAQHRLRRERQETALRHYEFRFVTKTGEIRNIFLTIDVIPGTKQSVASLMDITAQIRAQNAVKLAYDKLNLLNDITRHDILNQITAIQGYLDLYHNECQGDAKLEGYFTRLIGIASVIENQIQFTKFYEEVGVKAPVWQRVQDVATKAAETGAFGDVRFAIEATQLEIFADPLLEKAFFNMYDNSIRHGEHVTEIRVTNRVADGECTIFVEDDGAGIPADEKERIFERGVGKNTGLGLFLVREILSITGITIRENGVPGKGARFEINVPKGECRS